MAKGKLVFFLFFWTSDLLKSDSLGGFNMTQQMKWKRSEEGVIAGVCSGLADTLDLEVGILRVLLLVAVLFGGFGLFVYLGLAFSLPRADRLDQALDSKILGVCSKLAQRLEIEVGIVRFLALSLCFMSFGGVILAYVVAYFLISDSKKAPQQESKPQVNP